MTPAPGRKFRIELRPDSYGSEHENPHLRAANGLRVVLVEEVKPDLWRTDYVVSAEVLGVRNDYVWDGYLCVMPSKDGKVLMR